MLSDEMKEPEQGKERVSVGGGQKGYQETQTVQPLMIIFDLCKYQKS